MTRLNFARAAQLHRTVTHGTEAIMPATALRPADDTQSRPERACERCEKPFLPVRADARFCSVRCRVAAHRQLSVTMGKPELSVTAELSVTEPLNVKLPPLNLVEEGKPDRAFDPMSYLEMVDGEWQVTAHGRRVGPPREWLMEKAGLIDAQPTISPPEPPPPETVTAATRLAAIMADPILSDPHWFGMPIRPGGLSDDEWAGTLASEARCRHVRARRTVAGLEPAATRPAHAFTRPKGYSDAEWQAAVADAKRLGYSRSAALR